MTLYCNITAKAHVFMKNNELEKLTNMINYCSILLSKADNFAQFTKILVYLIIINIEILLLEDLVILIRVHNNEERICFQKFIIGKFNVLTLEMIFISSWILEKMKYSSLLTILKIDNIQWA